MHGEFLVLEKEKMAKSGENFITLSILESKAFDPLDYRYFCLGTHYRAKLNFSWEAVEGARNALKSLKGRIVDFKTDHNVKNSGRKKSYQKKFLKFVNDDLNMPLVLALIWDMFKDDELGSNEKLDLLLDFDKVLGLKLDEVGTEELSSEIQKLIDERERARQIKNWAKSDEIRDELKSRGYVVEDTPHGVRWKKL